MRHPRKTAVANMQFFVSSFSSKCCKSSSRLHEISKMAVLKTALVDFCWYPKFANLQFYLHGSLVFEILTCKTHNACFFQVFWKSLFFQCFFTVLGLREGAQGAAWTSLVSPNPSHDPSPIQMDPGGIPRTPGHSNFIDFGQKKVTKISENRALVKAKAWFSLFQQIVLASFILFKILKIDLSPSRELDFESNFLRLLA